MQMQHKTNKSLSLSLSLSLFARTQQRGHFVRRQLHRCALAVVADRRRRARAPCRRCRRCTLGFLLLLLLLLGLLLLLLLLLRLLLLLGLLLLLLLLLLGLLLLLLLLLLRSPFRHCGNRVRMNSTTMLCSLKCLRVFRESQKQRARNKQTQQSANSKLLVARL